MKANFDFRRKILIVFFIALQFILFNSCEHLLDSPSFSSSEKTTVGGALSAPTGLKASQGLRRKISLSWNAVNGAKYYSVYYAESNTAEFNEIFKTEKNSFDDENIGAGRTGYYKVRAVKSDGTQSSFSSIVRGTSLAQPIISNLVVDGSSATISWYMGNERSINGGDDYKDLLVFDVVCEPKNGNGGEIKTRTAATYDLSEYEYKFENLPGSQDYQFYVKAYLGTDQQSFETSSTVDETTLASYIPLAPKFRATKGESAKGITLFITLPEMVMVTTETKDSQNEKVDEPYPLYFKIFRKSENSNYSESPDAILYYNGKTSAPDTSDYSDSEKGYNPGVEIKWFDDSADLTGGEKYEYMILSFVDVNYSKVLWPEEKDAGKRYMSSVGTDPTNATTDIGWKSAHPTFEVERSKFENNGKEFSEDGSKILSVKFGFKAEWKDLGLAGNYKFAIKQSRKPLKEGEGDVKDTWLKNGEGEFFATLDEVKSYVIEFGSKEEGLSESEKGAYSYTLYVVAKSAEIGDVKDDSDKVLDAVKAMDEVIVSDDVNLPKAELAVEGGYTNKVVLTISSLEKNVRYVLIRSIMKNGVLESDGLPFVLDEIVVNDDNVGEQYDYEDTSLNDNCSYSYVLKAVAESGAYDLSAPQFAETLGIPKVEFVRANLSYDSVTISFKGVLAAQEYEITIGESEGFGNGDTFKFNVDGSKSDAGDSVSSEATAEISLTDNKYTVKINKPYGYDKANLAGMPAKVTVTAHSAVDAAESEGEGEDVNVIGPALLGADVEGGEESISVSWNKIEDVDGYLIRRVMYDDVEMKKVAEDSECTYYCEGRTAKITLLEGGEVGGRATATINGGRFELTDTYKKADSEDPDLQLYQEAQAKIAWGLPFKYVVLPVLNKDDFTFGTGNDSLELADGSEVTYVEKYDEKVKTDGVATWGYGLNLVAAKAASGNMQDIKWEKPHADIEGETKYAVTKPVVYRRNAGSNGEFELFSDRNDEIDKENAKAKMPISGADCYNAYEFLVRYYADGAPVAENITPPASLLDKIAKRKTEFNASDGKTYSEQDNKGYLLTIKDFSADIASEDYYETVAWKRWTYSDRAVGPDLMTVLIQNNNIGAEAKEALTVESANADKKIDYVGSDIYGEKLGESSIRIASKSIVKNGAGTAAADGLLKVLRDYRHNYTFKLTRAPSEYDKRIDEKLEDDIEVSNSDYEGTAAVKTAYRQITAKEFAIISGISIADTLFDSNYCSNSESNVGYDRTFIFNGKAKYFLSVTGTLYGYATCTGNKPRLYGAVCAGIMGLLSGGKSKPTTLTLKCDGVSLYEGTVTIDSMKDGGGSYIVNYNNQSGDFRSDVSGYFSYD